MVLIDVKEQLSGEDVVAFTVSAEFTVATLVAQRNPTARLQLRYFSFVIVVFIIAFVLSVCSICISVCAYVYLNSVQWQRWLRREIPRRGLN